MLELEKINVEWIPVEYMEDVEEQNEEDRIKPGFKWKGDNYFLSEFIRCHNNPWGNMDVPDNIHGYEAGSYFPLFVELSDDSRYVNIYKLKK